MPGLDAFQLVDIMMRLTRKEMAIPTQGDDLADFQQFVASGTRSNLVWMQQTCSASLCSHMQVASVLVCYAVMCC